MQRAGRRYGLILVWLQIASLTLLPVLVLACGQAEDLSSPTATPTKFSPTATVAVVITRTPTASPTADRVAATATQKRDATPLTTTVPNATATANADLDTANTPTLRPPGGTFVPETEGSGTPVGSPVAATATPAPPTATMTEVPPTATPTPTPTPAPPTATPELCAGAIPWYEANYNIGGVATVIGPVVGAVYASDSAGAPTFLNIGADYPDASRFTALIWVEYRGNFPAPPEDMYLDATVCVAGFIEEYEGVAEILVTGPDQIWIP